MRGNGGTAPHIRNFGMNREQEVLGRTNRLLSFDTWTTLEIDGQTIFLLQLLCFWTLSVVLFLFKTHNVSESGFYLRLQVEPNQLGPIGIASPYLRTPAPTQDRTYKPSTAQTNSES
jgi:hypothetical protein